MMPIQFPTVKILPVEDPTERVWHDVAGLARDFEAAAQTATTPGRCAQLHERIYACLQTLNDADKAVCVKWDDLLAKGFD